MKNEKINQLCVEVKAETGTEYTSVLDEKDDRL